MAIFRGGLSPLVIGGLSLMIMAIAPAWAGEPATCNWTQANVLRAQGDRYRTGGHFLSAARAYIAASRSVRDCRTASGLMLSARSLAQGGTALAQSGDYLNGRLLLQSAQSRLQSLFAVDAQTAAAARSYFDLVQNVITAIDRVAQSSM